MANETRDMIGKTFHRDMTVEERSAEQKDNRTATFSMSSEMPVERYFGDEVLVHEKDAIRMDFLASGNAPVLLGHNHDRQIGVITKAWLDAEQKKIRVNVKFSKSQLASEIMDDIDDGIRKNISVGYEIHQIERTKRQGEGNDLVRVTDWEPFEASIVSVPADASVGIGRSQHQPEPQEGDPVPQTNPNPEPVDVDRIAREAADAARREAEASRDEAVREASANAARQRGEEVALIMEVAARHNMSAEAQRMVGEGATLAQFQRHLMDTLPDGEPIVRNSGIGLSERETRNFSILRLARACDPQASARTRDEARFEIEACQAAEDARPEGVREARGFRMPPEIMEQWRTGTRMSALGRQGRALNPTDEGDLVPTEHLASMFVDVLRNKASVMRAGARIIQGLEGNIDIPAKLAQSVASWVATDTTDAPASEFTTRTISMTPKDIRTHMDVTRRLRQQSSPDVEMLMRDDIAQSVAEGVDLAGLEGTGAAGQPTGVLNTAGVNTPTAFAGPNPTYAEVVAMETAVADDNALMGSLAYIGRTNMYGALKTTTKDAGSGQFVVEPGGTVNGYRYIDSNKLTDGNLYFGNWNDLMFGMWGSLDLVFDYAALALSGGLRIIAFQTCDVAVRHAESFAYNNDGI